MERTVCPLRDAASMKSFMFSYRELQWSIVIYYLASGWTTDSRILSQRRWCRLKQESFTNQLVLVIKALTNEKGEEPELKKKTGNFHWSALISALMTSTNWLVKLSCFSLHHLLSLNTLYSFICPRFPQSRSFFDTYHVRWISWLSYRSFCLEGIRFF